MCFYLVRLFLVLLFVRLFIHSFVRSFTHLFIQQLEGDALCFSRKKMQLPALCLRFNLSVLQLPSLLFPSRQGVAAAALELVCIFMTLTSMRTAAPGSRAARPAAGQRHLPLSTPASSTSRHLPSLQGRAWCPPYTQPPESLALEGLW